jgi:hypothetical protein
LKNKYCKDQSIKHCFWPVHIYRCVNECAKGFKCQAMQLAVVTLRENGIGRVGQ